MPAPLKTVVARPLERKSSRTIAAWCGDIPADSGMDRRPTATEAGPIRCGILIY
jgi:hypothetical protein